MTLLTGCSVIGAGSDTSDTEVSVRANITDKASMQAVVAAFRRARPGIHVNVSYADTNTLQKELPQQLRAGKAPDVFTVWPGSGNPASVLALEEDDFLEALSLRFFAGRIPDSMRPVTDGGVGTYLVPVTFSAVGAIYSAETLKAIGGTRPTTYSTLLALCDTARRHGKVLFALGNQTPWVTQLVDYALVATTVYAHDPGFDTQMESGKESFARSGWRQAMAKYLEMRDRGCFSTAPLKPVTRTPSTKWPTGEQWEWSRSPALSPLCVPRPQECTSG
ncbi:MULTISPECIES: ABC transporter substrate-binding protein [unclassified Streptomyces]|uniref:ABC transporter substrate-binding protein n=1 Tax=unclassified Streptomyces TaxID=2593676 RepID=UPI00224EC72C|nr:MULTISPECIES: ABC transporter substrate-binding protein [unclassified Streptomyces]MCX4992945.1 ABC transporter substrate-binding protein [Streptomyces sp. NBC_00568]MCX5001819.1 ABC transporter substrate-binding protein [Streptomyces sp. NBC_00638]